MAIPSTVTLQDSAAANHNFELLRSLPNGNDRIKTGSTVAQPVMLAVRHSSQKLKSGVLVDRRSVVLSWTKIDADENEYVAQAVGTMVIPRTTLFTETDVYDLRAWCTNFIGAYKADLILGKS